jgi:hypothetical protein
MVDEAGMSLAMLRLAACLATVSPGILATLVRAYSGMMREIFRSLPQPWPEGLPERITRPILHGIGVPWKSRKSP